MKQLLRARLKAESSTGDSPLMTLTQHFYTHNETTVKLNKNVYYESRKEA
jgi:hypothetical protein